MVKFRRSLLAVIFLAGCSQHSVISVLPDVRGDMDFLKASISMEPVEKIPDLIKDSAIYIGFVYAAGSLSSIQSEKTIQELSAMRGYTLTGYSETNSTDNAIKKTFCHPKFPKRALIWGFKGGKTPQVVVAITVDGMSNVNRNCRGAFGDQSSGATTTH